MTQRLSSNNERVKRLRESVARLTPLAAHDPQQWQFMLDIATTRLHHAINEARAKAPSTVGDFHRDVFAGRLRHEIMQETHVIVGDHPPEPRVR